MREPIFARPLSDAERETLKAALRSPDAFTLRRCQILLSSADGKKSAYKIASKLGCNSQTVRNVIHKRSTGEAFKRLLERAPAAHTPRLIRPSMNTEPRLLGRCCTRVPGTSARIAACGPWRWLPRRASRRVLPPGG